MEQLNQNIPNSFVENKLALDGGINPLTGRPDRRRRHRTPEERAKISRGSKIGMELFKLRMKKEKGIPNIFSEYGKKSARVKKAMKLEQLPKEKKERDTLQKLKKEKYFLLQTAGLAESKKDAAIKAGFDIETANKAEALIETGDDWDKIMKKYFRDDTIASRHFDLIMQNKDKGTAMKGIELVYKMKKRFEENEGGGIAPIKMFITKIEVGEKTKEELEQQPETIIQDAEVIDEIEDTDLKNKVMKEIEKKLHV